MTEGRTPPILRFRAAFFHSGGVPLAAGREISENGGRGSQEDGSKSRLNRKKPESTYNVDPGCPVSTQVAVFPIPRGSIGYRIRQVF